MTLGLQPRYGTATRKVAESSFSWEEMGSVLQQVTQVCWKGWVADEGLSLLDAENFLTAAVPSSRLCRRKSARMCPSPFPRHGRAQRMQGHVGNTQAGAWCISWLGVPGRATRCRRIWDSWVGQGAAGLEPAA